MMVTAIVTVLWTFLRFSRLKPYASRIILTLAPLWHVILVNLALRDKLLIKIEEEGKVEYFAMSI